MNRWIDEASKAGALIISAVVLLLGARDGARPWILGLRLLAVFFGVWGAGYLVGYVTSRVLLSEAVRREETRLTAQGSRNEVEAAKRRSRAA